MARNNECDQIYFILSGSATVHSERGDFSINPGDVYFFERGEAYWIYGRNLHLAVSNSPAWTPDQYEYLE